MKINKLFAFGTLLLASLAFTACSDDDDYTAGPQSDGAYLYSSASSYTFLPADEQVLTVNIGRTDSTQAATYNLTGDNSLFQVPSSVSFAAGEKNKEIKIPFNLNLGQREGLSIKLNKDQATTYGFDSIHVTVLRDYQWENAGSGTFIENTITGDSVENVAVQHGQNSNVYRIVSPLSTLFDGVDNNLQFTLDASGNVSLELADGIYDWLPGSGYQVYWNTARYPQYCTFTNDNGTINMEFPVTDGGSIYLGGEFIFKWYKGYPLAASEE